MYGFSENGIVSKWELNYTGILEGAGPSLRPRAVWKDCPLVFK